MLSTSEYGITQGILYLEAKFLFSFKTLKLVKLWASKILDGTEMGCALPFSMKERGYVPKQIHDLGREVPLELQANMSF